jgi:hypothetical protein
MRLLKPQRGPWLLGPNKYITLTGLIILFIFYWLFAFELEKVDYVPLVFDRLVDGLRLFGPVMSPFVYIIERVGPYFSLRVLRHLIPPLVGWYIARLAILGLIQSFYDLRDSHEAANLLERLSAARLGFIRPTVVNLQTFEENRKKDPVLKIGGPGRIVVFRDAALVTELNGRFHRVLGPGRHDLERFEFAKTLVDLCPQERESDNVKMMTSDGIPLTTSLTVTYQILWGDDKPTKNKPFPYDPEAVKKAAYSETVQPDGSITRWDSLAMLITGGQLRTIVAEEKLDELIVSEANGIEVHRRLQLEMERRAKNIMRGYGVMIRGTRLGALELPKEVEALRKRYWQASWDTQRTRQMTDGEVKILESLEFARAEAEAIMLQAIAEGLQRAQRAGRNISSKEVVALRLIESLESMAKSSEQILPLPERLMPQLGSLRQQLLLNSGAASEPTEEAANKD